MKLLILPLTQVKEFLDNVIDQNELSSFGTEMSKTIIRALNLLIDIKLGHLTLYREMPSLSGGELQRVFLHEHMESQLDSLIYVFDEPTSGLHESEKQGIIDSLQALKKQGNTVIVVTHDKRVIKAADNIIDVGEKAGDLGGEIVFQDTTLFYEQSINILKHLYNTSNHPNIKSGDFYMVYFSDEKNETNIIGIFKSENKDTFLKIKESSGSFSFSYQKGLNLKKLDKGCLIVNRSGIKDYDVLVIDSSAKTDNTIAKYWEQDFLGVKRYQDDDVQTKELIKISDKFSDKVYDRELNKTPKEIFDFKKSAFEYIKKSETYDNDEFVEKLFESENEKKVFKDFKKEYEKEKSLSPIDKFGIAKDVVKKTKKKIVSKIKLDTGINLQVSDYKFIEEGYDEENKMKYLKIYYNSKE